jgi:hypothetical protein
MGRLNTVDLHVLTSLDQLLLTLKTLFTFYKTSYLNEEGNYTVLTRLDQLFYVIEKIIYFFTKQATSMNRSTILSLLLLLVFPCLDINLRIIYTSESVGKTWAKSPCDYVNQSNLS